MPSYIGNLYVLGFHVWRKKQKKKTIIRYNKMKRDLLTIKHNNKAWKITYYCSMMQAFRSLANHLVFQSLFSKTKKRKNNKLTQINCNMLEYIMLQKWSTMMSYKKKVLQVGELGTLGDLLCLLISCSCTYIRINLVSEPWGGCTVWNMYDFMWVHERWINLNFVVPCIHMLHNLHNS